MYDITMKAVALPHIQTLGYITEKNLLSNLSYKLHFIGQ